MTTLQELQTWIDQVAELTQPDDVYWCNGSAEEYRELAELLLSNGGFVELNQETHPGCYLHRSDPSDVARVEHLTFVCTSSEEDAGPNNNWMAPGEARAKMKELFRGCMKGRTMYVIPYCMGPIDSPLSRCGVEITDSAYVVANMNLMTRMGDAGTAAHRARRDVRQGPALHRRAGPGTPFHHAFSRRPGDSEFRFRLRRQRAAGQEVPRPAHRQPPGADRGLAGRAHADRRAWKARRARCITSLRLFRPPAARPTWP